MKVSSMPEGPEVKISCEVIKPWLINQKFLNLKFSNSSKYRINKPSNLNTFLIESIGRSQIIDVLSHGKKIYITFDNGWTIENGFGMTGQWSKEKSEKHNCFELELNNIKYYFNDIRHFANIDIFRSDIYHGIYIYINNYLGIDLLKKSSLDEELILNLHLKIINKNIKIAEILLDQNIFPGVGNYIRAEALYQAKLNPFIKGHQISLEQTRQLISSCHRIMHQSYQAQGATLRNFKTPDGKEGKYSFNFQVYNQKTDPNGYKVEKNKINNRTIHWVPEIQK